MTKHLIVNADDLGLSESINDGILESHLQGIVTSTTLMMTMPAVEHAVECTRKTSLDVGLHLDFTWGTSISPPSEIASLVQTDRKFHGKKELMKRLVLFRIRSCDLEKEIEAQITRFRETGLPLYHLDVHQHFHGFPLVMRSLARVAKREQVPFIRFVNELSFNKPVDAVIYSMFAISRICLPKHKRGTDHFLGLALTDRLNSATLRPQLTAIQPGITELMCHPGYDAPELQHLSRLQCREAEIEALTSSEIKEFIASNNINLTTYRDIYYSKEESNTL